MTALKSTIIGFALFLLVTSTWAGTFTDNFDDGNLDGWDVGNVAGRRSNWKVENGELVLQAIDGPIGAGLGELTWKDYTVSVKFKITAHQPHGRFTEGAGISIRSVPPLNSYVFTVGTGGAVGNTKLLNAFYVKDSDVPKHYEFSPFDWKLNTWYDLKVIAEGDQFKIYVDDKLVHDYVDAALPAGRVALTVSFMGTTAHFDDFSVTGDDILDTVAAVDPKAKLVTTWATIKNGK
jgi:hypothetical protein